MPLSAKARRANVFFTTWNSPPASRILARILSRSFIFTPVYSTRITAWLRFIQSAYCDSTSSLRSFVIAKGHSPPFKKKVFATLFLEFFQGRQRLLANPREGRGIVPIFCFRLHLSRKLSPKLGHPPSLAKWRTSYRA